MGKFSREDPHYSFEKGDGTEYCHSCSRSIMKNAYCVKWIPRTAFGGSEVVLCVHCSIDIGELGKNVKERSQNER